MAQDFEITTKGNPVTIRSTTIAAAVAIAIGSPMPIALAATGNTANPTAAAITTPERHAFFFGTLYCMATGQGSTWLKAYMKFTETPEGAVAHIWEGGCVA